MSQEESNHQRAQDNNSITIELQNDDIYSQIGQQHPPDLNSLLNKLQDQVPNSQWYHFGQALQVPREILDQLKEHSAEDSCLTELLDYWLKNHKGRPTWQEVTEAQRRIDFNQQANGIDREQYSE